MEGPKTEKARKPTAESLVRAIWRQLEKQSGEYERACKVEDSHRDKTEKAEKLQKSMLFSFETDRSPECECMRVTESSKAAHNTQSN